MGCAGPSPDPLPAASLVRGKKNEKRFKRHGESTSAGHPHGRFVGDVQRTKFPDKLVIANGRGERIGQELIVRSRLVAFAFRGAHWDPPRLIE